MKNKDAIKYSTTKEFNVLYVFFHSLKQNYARAVHRNVRAKPYSTELYW